MKTYGSWCGAIAGAALLLAGSAHAADSSSITPLIAKGKHFFYSDNKQEFFLRGVAYQPGYNQKTGSFGNKGFTDPLADEAACKRDIPYLKQLKTNIIRTYAIDPTANHKPCMDMLAEAGIYLVADLSSPLESITPNEPQWTTDLFARYASVVDALQSYNNVMGFFAGNEVINTPNQTYTAPYVKAAVRDTKAYIKSKYPSRPMYVGYATADVGIRGQLADYFNCGDQTDAVDFWGYNVYSWCSADTTYQSSHYAARTRFFESYSVPAFFAEYGCVVAGETRQWTDVPVLYGPKMAPVWSGGIAYQYFQTENDFGLVNVSGSTVTPLSNFKYLKQEMASVNPTSMSYSSVNTGTVRSCPASSSQWHVSTTQLPPPANEELCNCLEQSLSCVVKNGVSQKTYKSDFGFICGAVKGVCDDIDNIPNKFQWGKYSACSAKQKLSYVMDQYYISQNRNSDACDFKGSGQFQKASTSSQCKSLLGQANSNNGHSIPEPSNVPSSSSSSGGNGGSNSAAGLTAPKLGMSAIQMGVYSLVAALTGAVILVL